MVTSHIYAIRLFLEYLQQEGILEANPMGSVTFERAGYKEREVLSREEIRLLYNTCDTLRRHGPVKLVIWLRVKTNGSNHPGHTRHLF